MEVAHGCKVAALVIRESEHRAAVTTDHERVTWLPASNPSSKLGEACPGPRSAASRPWLPQSRQNKVESVDMCGGTSDERTATGVRSSGLGSVAVSGTGYSVGQVDALCHTSVTTTSAAEHRESGEIATGSGTDCQRGPRRNSRDPLPPLVADPGRRVRGAIVLGVGLQVAWSR
jgi:hypothetical protein